jgi:hypothetical protein
MRRLILLIDGILRRRQKIEEFWDHPDCLLRISRRPAPCALPLRDGQIPAGAPLLEIHLWNEHLAHAEPADSSLAWGAKSGSALVRSLAALARHMERRADGADVAAVFGVTTFMSEKEAETAERLLARLGFAFAPYRSSLGAFGDFWENLHVWLLHRAFRHSVRRAPLFGLRRKMLWMSKEDLLYRYAPRGSRIEHRPAAARTRSSPTGAAWRSIS